jgi:hypothetical protein
VLSARRPISTQFFISFLCEQLVKTMSKKIVKSLILILFKSKFNPGLLNLSQ